MINKILYELYNDIIIIFFCIITNYNFSFRKFLQLIDDDHGGDDDDMDKKRRRRLYSSDEMEQVKNMLSNNAAAATAPHHHHHHKTYYVRKKFIMNEEGKIQNVKNGKLVIEKNSIFDFIKQAHTACGHGGIKRTRHELFVVRNIENVTYRQISKFISLCEICQKKKQKFKKQNSSSSSSILSTQFGERGQVDLIDLSMHPTEEGYKYILNYQDHLTKFLMLRPLKSKRSHEVNECLLNIFTIIGAPKILQCDNGTEFSEIRTKVLDLYWPESRLINSRPRHPQSQGSIERANGDVMNMVRSWMYNDDIIDHENVDWAKELKFIQWQKNTALNRNVTFSPFKATFGITPPVHFNPGGGGGGGGDYRNIASTSQENYDDDDDDDEEENTIENVTATLLNIRNKVAKKQSDNNHKSNDDDDDIVNVGTSVVLNVPKIDRSKMNFNNIVGIIDEYLPTIKKYTIKTIYGILNRKVRRQDFEICNNLNVDKIVSSQNTNLISLRCISRYDCLKFVGCSCTTTCSTNYCFCRKNNKKCCNFCKHRSKCRNM